MIAGARRAAALAAILIAPACAARRAAPPLHNPEVVHLVPRLPPQPRAAAGSWATADRDPSGTVHVVKRGETLYRIARTYGIDSTDLMRANDISDPRTLRPGAELFIPGAIRPLDVPPAPADSEPLTVSPPEAVRPSRRPTLAWPVHGALYSRFGTRQRGQRHDGIDISAPEGMLVGAAAAGTVVYIGRQAGYGSIVILRHASGLVTVYAHASAILVKEGDEVEAGSPIARVGHSGRTTGSHLHFEVREGTRPRDPLIYLP